ncbi:glycerol kinase GlpK [Opitutus sp. ER46]|uniref:FGGY family carbohydrate kinase n=1 Tax=Opitutus sp. ER46 TaxID=2161864 RepID=UPI000D30A8E5|nr:glycerol kinase GlpK [Opitutus sp. ER46]PTX94387.1 glycerol kinase [Opitutus sp. ER46]
MSYVLAIDQSTSATKVLLFDKRGVVKDSAAREHRQYYPQPGWVEHDAEEIWRNTLEAAGEVIGRNPVVAQELTCISISNQRETVVVFDQATGLPLHRALVWQDRRGDALCAEQIAAGHEAAIRAKTGLRVDSYFSASKLQWLIRNRPDLATKMSVRWALIGTMDAYLIYRMTSGTVFATDQTNASRTLLFDISRMDWDDELCSWWQVPRKVLPQIRSSADSFGETTLGGLLPQPVPIRGVMGDSQASLFAQRCFEPGAAKATFGSGSSVLLNVGAKRPAVERGSVCTVGWVHAGQPTYVLEGIVTFSGATLTWLRDQLGLFANSGETETMAREIPDNGGVYLVPAFSGLGAPHWRETARGAIVGLSAHSDRRHIVRAGLESIAYQLRDVLDMMQADAGVTVRRLHGDGGATTNAFLMQFAADLTGVELRVARSPHYSPLGAAMMGLLGSGVHRTLGALAELPRDDTSYQPRVSRDAMAGLHAGWQRALQQVLVS